MRFSAFSASSASLVALGVSLLASSAPLKRTAAPTDLLVLNFALVLEQFETQFYTQAIAKFQESDFISAGFSSAQVAIQQFTAIQIDESVHVSILESTIISQGGTPITSCQFNFDAALTDVSTMAATARMVENLGVSAYLGAAHLISDSVLLTAAATIVTVEARHQTVLNILNGGSAIPQAFDIAFTPSEVLAIASPFISGCDTGVPANPTLSVTNTGSVLPGTSLTFSSIAINASISVETLSCQMLIGGAPFAIVLPYTQCVVPDGINGPVAIWVTSDAQPLNNNVRDQATDKIIAGPTMAFIDTSPEMIGQLARTGSASASSATLTLTPAEASAVAASAAAAAGAAPTGAVSVSNNAASTSDVATPGGANMYTGAVGTSINVNGWSSVPPS